MSMNLDEPLPMDIEPHVGPRPAPAPPKPEASTLDIESEIAHSAAANATG